MVAELARQRLISCLLCLVIGFGRVVLLTGHGVESHQLLIAGEICGREIHHDFGLGDRSQSDSDIGGCDADTTVGHSPAGNGVLPVGAGLREAETHVGIINHDKSIALADRFEFFETDFAYIPLHTAVDGHNLLAYLGIVGELDIAETEKFTAHPCGGYCYDSDGYDI